MSYSSFTRGNVVNHKHYERSNSIQYFKKTDLYSDINGSVFW